MTIELIDLNLEERIPEEERTYTLPDKKTIVLGRSLKCDLFVNNPMVSGRHCEINHLEGSYTVRDLESKNGTYLNGDKIEYETALKDNDQLNLARVYRFKVRIR